MTTTRNPNRHSSLPDNALSPEFDLDQEDQEISGLLQKISRANVLERSGNLLGARTLYEEVAQADPSGSFGASARQALAGLETSAEPTVLQVEPQSSPAVEPPARRRSLLQWFYDLPISRKQLIALLASELVSVIGLGLGARIIVENGLRAQLLNQAKSEVAVTEINYNIKINQMGFGFRGQADNTAIIAAAKIQGMGRAVPPSLQNQVRQILQNETKARKIEYATLVGKDLRIITSANADRRGEVFNPNNLVQQVFTDPRQIKASAVVSWDELVKEGALLPKGLTKQNALIRYTITPVKDPATGTVMGALISGDIANSKLPIVKETLKAFGGGYSAVYFQQPNGQFALATALQQRDTQSLDQAEPTALPEPTLLEMAAAKPGESVTTRITVGAQTYTVAAKALPSLFKETATGPTAIAGGQPVAFLVRGTPETALNELLHQSLLQELAVLAVALLLIGFWAVLLRRAIVQPVEQLQTTAQQFSEGDSHARATVQAMDEVGQLATTFNQMADKINAAAKVLEEQAQQRQLEADFQRREKERLQAGVIKLLLEIEGAQQGDLTVQAKLDEGEMGSIADAFNTTIQSLRDIVLQVKLAADQVHSSAFSSESSVEHLVQEANVQAQSISTTLNAVEQMGQSIQSIAASTQAAVQIAHQALEVAHNGDQIMDQTVSSMSNIRTSVAETSKKMKRLAESSQEISKIVSIISGISEKTNLLAFNASIEAARAGENGQGFRVVADEVRRLAERVTTSAREIEQLISTMQQETSEVLQTMEASTTQVVTGTQQVAATKQTLQELARISQGIDEILRSISDSTVSQTEMSQTVSQTMQAVASIAQTTSSESAEVAASLQQLVQVAEQLQSSVSRFQVEK